MKRSTVIVLEGALLFGGAAFLVWRHVSRLADRVADLSGQVEEAVRDYLAIVFSEGEFEAVAEP